jgi:hypothetical protein
MTMPKRDSTQRKIRTATISLKKPPRKLRLQITKINKSKLKRVKE